MGAWTPNGLKQLMEDAVAARTWYVSFHTGDPGLTGANEYTSAGIGRVATGAISVTTDADSADGDNDVAINSALATGNTSAITHVGLWTAASGGVFCAGHELAQSVTLAAGGRISVPAGDMDWSLTV